MSITNTQDKMLGIGMGESLVKQASSSPSRTFHLIEQTKGMNSMTLVVDEHGVPRNMLSAFYEHLQDKSEAAAIHLLLPFFCFLHAQTPYGCWWDGPPAAIRKAMDVYLVDRYGCILMPKKGNHTVVFTDSLRRVQHFLTTLTRFYRFSIEQHGYWYEHPLKGYYALRPLMLYALSNCINSFVLATRKEP
jgi:hypothetical protein